VTGVEGWVRGASQSGSAFNILRVPPSPNPLPPLGGEGGVGRISAAC
jgi:hypothetical protein